VDFTNVVLIMTSNLVGDPQAYFKPEFINRIDEIIRFRPLSKEDMRPIVDIQLRDLQGRMVQRRLDLVVTDTARDWLAVRGYDEAFGARPLKRLIQREVGDTLATALLAGSFGEGETVTVDVIGDDIVLA